MPRRRRGRQQLPQPAHRGKIAAERLTLAADLLRWGGVSSDARRNGAMADTATIAAPARPTAEVDDPAGRPVVTLLPGGHRRAEAGHPWVYSNEIAMDAAAKALAPGTLATLRRADERPLGVAMFNPHTLLAARLLDRDAARPIGKRFFARHIERALRLRERLFRMPYYRLVHAEADGLPGLVIDRFGDVLVVQANAAGMDRLEPLILHALSAALSPAGIPLRNDIPAPSLPAAAARHNGVAERCTFRRGEVFAEAAALAAAGERFDIVVADPPPFARAKRDIGPALRGYRKLARLAAQLTVPGGFLFLASCSHNVAAGEFAEAVRRGLADAGRGGRLPPSAGASPDHPVHPALPETAYLKSLTLALD